MTTILFLCPHGGAKSLIAASYFNRAAAHAGLPFAAVAAAGEDPYESVPAPVADLLESQGFTVRSFEPRCVEPDDIRSAAHIVSIDCDLTALDLLGAAVERWEDVPMVSDDLPGSAAAIRRHVRDLIEKIRERNGPEVCRSG
jgi:protein-tyrosine-phosphatase